MRRQLAVFAAVALLIASVGKAQAATIGGSFFYTGGDVTVTSAPVSSAFTSELGLYDSSFTRLLFLMNDEPPGVVNTFNPGVLFGFVPGDELIFGIRVLDDPDHPELPEYFMGPAARNPDGIFHGGTDIILGFLVGGFEDIYGGGDMDFDDNVFIFEGGISAPSEVPEPATLSLLVLGVLPMVWYSRRRSRRTES